MIKTNEELLTNEEMSALLPETPPAGAAQERDKRQRIVPYNFRRPDRLSKEQVRSLYLLHDLFAQSLSSSLPLFLRAITEVNLISVEQQSYADYLRGMSDPAIIFTVNADALNGVFAVEINSSVAFPIIDRMLGGGGLGLNEQRAATEVELKILEGFLETMTESYREAWKPLVEFKTELTGHETRPQFLQIVAPNEVVAVVVYQMQIGDAQGSLSICLPVTMLEAVIEKFSQSAYSQTITAVPEATHSMLQTISSVRFPLAAELEETPTAVADLMTLAVGDVLRTNHRIEKTINVRVDNSLKFVGRLAAMEGKMVVQVTETKQRTPSPKAV
nr:fliM_switch: flagellar motor switch protein [uncultured bacterium]